MEVKKSPKADLEGKKSTWLLIGYVFILALMFVAFEWTDRDKQVTTETGITDVVFEEEIIPITEHLLPGSLHPDNRLDHLILVVQAVIHSLYDILKIKGMGYNLLKRYKSLADSTDSGRIQVAVTVYRVNGSLHGIQRGYIQLQYRLRRNAHKGNLSGPLNQAVPVL